MCYKKEHLKMPGYEKYQIDTNGTIYSKRGKPLKPSINPRGYYIVTMCINGKARAFSLHRLIATQFIENDCPQYKTQVNHIDGNKLNNKVNNLEWCTPVENMRHSVNILGNNVGNKNGNATPIYAVESKTHNFKYQFPCIMDAAKFFCKQGHNPRYVQCIIWKVLNHKSGNKSYKGCEWFYGTYDTNT